MENPMIRRMKALVLLAFLVGWGVAAAQSSRDLAWAEKNPFQGAVTVWYGSHLETTGIHDWVPIKKWNGPFHPLLGNYKTGNRRFSANT
jgi:hypothetical protein